ncbi:phosphatase PAP2 family protein [Curvibacter lanceolatus]|jgi:membrane-associated phospholipid phosphatase|uniref:phosphatase PAP2 family protein n=1 Tax=Curvibacter lanceolatus TaxID=86182 RepID=UPI00035E539F|nr:phosphatase PAP2 family protein [Curvibacter lanceolatus]
MIDWLPVTPQTWESITSLGSAGLMLPVWLLTWLGVWLARERLAAGVWLVTLGGAVALTLISKTLFIGWGIGIAAWDFTGFSGHTLLATSVFPILCSLLLAPQHRQWRWLTAALGLGVAALVAFSRVVLGAHSVSEVVLAWLLGSVVCVCTLLALGRVKPFPRLAGLLPLALLLLAGRAAPHLPTHEWEVRIALKLSGAERPYTREQFQQQSGASRERAQQLPDQATRLAAR